MDFKNKTFNQEEKELLINFLDTYKLPGLKTPNTEWKIGSNVELITNPRCNQRCKYCYITQYGNELYPDIYDKNTCLNNLDALLNLLKENKIFIGVWEIFGGDLFIDNIVFDINDKLIAYLKFVQTEAYDLFKSVDARIIIPNNLAYITIDSYYERLYAQYKDAQAAGITINYSWSTDGKYAIDAREQKPLDDDYWDLMFNRAGSFKAGMHPMISPENVESWCENYQWWLDMFEKHKITTPTFYQPSMLEVRNDGWTEEKIEAYLKFVRTVFITILEKNDNSPQKMAAHMFCGDGRDGSLPMQNGQNPLSLIYMGDDVFTRDRMPCSIQDQLQLYLGDMSIVPCHRTSYKHFRGGYFVIEDNKIVDIAPYNVSTFITFQSAGPNHFPLCSECEWRDTCIKGCLGSQYEYSGELYLPIPSVCNLLKAKYSYLIILCCQTGVLQEAIQHNYIRNEHFKRFLIRKSKELGFDLEGELNDGQRPERN